MKLSGYFCWFLLPLLILSCGRSETAQPFLSLNPDNPHYFLFRGKPEVLIGSTEHYGAVMNLDFNYVKYLNEIASSGLNITRLFQEFMLSLPGHSELKGTLLLLLREDTFVHGQEAQSQAMQMEVINLT